MRKGMGMVLLLVGIALVAPRGAQAGCTASLLCNDACSEHLTCSTGIVLACSAPNLTVSCSGTTTCTQGTSSVTCDGTVTACKTAASRCAKDAVSILCDSTFKQCPTCGGRICQSSPQAEPNFWSAPSEAGAAPAEVSGTAASAACF